MVMLRVTSASRQRNLYLWIPILVSVILHLAFYVTSSELLAKPRKSYQTIHVVIQEKQPKPKPPESQPKPEPRPKSKPKPKPKPKEPPAPKPNRDKPPQPEEPPPEPPKEIFGVTADSVTDQGGGVAVRVGNTLNKEMEKEYFDPSKIKPITGPPKPRRRRLVPVHELTKVPSFKKRVVPDYPDEARRNEIEGVVELEVLIDEKGRVIKVRVRKSLGYGCDEAAIAAVRKALFNPALKGDRPVPTKIRIPFRFVLED